jgi:hypothetical protein
VCNVDVSIVLDKVRCFCFQMFQQSRNVSSAASPQGGGIIRTLWGFPRGINRGGGLGVPGGIIWYDSSYGVWMYLLQSH